MDKTITYAHKGKDYSLNVQTPYTDNLQISVNNVICGYVSQEAFIENSDEILGRAVDRYEAEKELGLIR